MARRTYHDVSCSRFLQSYRAKSRPQRKFVQPNRRLRIEHLEDRCLLAASAGLNVDGLGGRDALYFPATHELVGNTNVRTSTAIGSPLQTAIQYLTDNASS